MADKASSKWTEEQLPQIRRGGCHSPTPREIH
jgi:hypothetical protein